MTYCSIVGVEAFALIKSRRRIIEPRLYNDAHRRIKVGDMIIFINRDGGQEIVAKVVGLLRFGSFKELFNSYPTDRFGKPEHELLKDMRVFYGDQEQPCGVVGLKVHCLT